MKAKKILDWRLWLIVGLCCTGASTVAEETSRPSTVALVLGEADRAPGPLAEIALMEICSGLPDVQLVEREAIRRVLDELKLNASGLVDPATATKFGRLVSADAFVLVEKLPIAAKRSVGRAPGATVEAPEKERSMTRLRVIETRTGIRLLDHFWPQVESKRDRAELVAELKRAMKALRRGEADRRYVGVIGIRSEQSSETLDPTALALTAMVEHDLQRLPGVVVLEREQLRRLSAERDLTGIELKLRASTVLLEGGLRRSGDGKSLSITLKLLPLVGGKARHSRVSAASGDMAALRKSLLGAARAALNAPENGSQIGDLRKEARILAQRARGLKTHVMGLESEKLRGALSLAEAAVALDATPEYCRLAADICHRCSARGMIRQTAAGLRYSRRFHEVDLARLQLCLRRPDKYPEELHAHFTGVSAFLERLTDGDEERRQLLTDINSICKRKLELLVEQRRRRGATQLELLPFRLRQAYVLSLDAGEFHETIRRHVAALDRHVEDGSVDRAECEQYYAALEYQLPHLHMYLVYGFWVRAAAPDEAMDPDADERLRELEKTYKAKFRPTFQWLAKHHDPATRVIGYYGLCELSEDDNIDAAVRLLDTAFHKINKDRCLDADWISRTTRKAATILVNADRMAGYFEPILSRAEAADDATILVRCPRGTFECANLKNEEESRDFLRRLVVLIDAGAYDRRHAAAAKSLRKLCIERLEKIDPDFIKPRDIGPWVNYVTRSIPMASNDLPNTHLLAVCIDRSSDANGKRPEFVLIWKRDVRDKQSGRRTAELLAYRMDIRGGPLREVGRCELPASPAVHSVAVGGGAIFVGTRRHGLAVISKSGGELFGESKGAPGKHVQNLAWLDGRLYMSLEGTIAKFDPAAKLFTVLASSKHVRQRRELDGGGRYIVSSLAGDPKRHCLWISISREGAPSKRIGVWQYMPATSDFKHVYQGSAARLSWCGDKLMFGSGYRGHHQRVPPSTGGGPVRISGKPPEMDCFQLDPDTLTAKALKGYTLPQMFPDTHCNVDWIRVGRHIVTKEGWLYTPDGERYSYYDREKANPSGSELVFRESYDRAIVGRLGQGFVFASYDWPAPRLWLIEPRSGKREASTRRSVGHRNGKASESRQAVQRTTDEKERTQ